MPALVNCSGDDEFYSSGSFYANPMDLGRLCSISSYADAYYPSCKRARVTAPFLVEETVFEQHEQPSIDVLPEECMYEIFKRLAGARERIFCASVSKQWLMLLTSIRKGEFFKCKNNEEISTSEDQEMISNDDDDDGCLTRCLEAKKATDMRLAAISLGTSGHGGLGKLSIRGSNSSRVTDFGLSAIAHGCPSLKALSLWNVPLVGDEGVSKIAKECFSLEKLDLCHCPSISNKGLISIAENCPNLTSLELESCPKIGDEGLQAIAKLCPKLQSISIKDCPLVGDRGVSSLFTLGSSVLTKVKLQGLNITDFSLAVIGHCGKSMTNLVLCGLQNVSEKGFWVMGNAQALQKLISLAITSCRGVTDLSIEALGKSCASLRQMCLRKCCFVSDSGLVNFAKAAGTLESLHLEECDRVSQHGILGVLSISGQKLKSLALVKCMGVKDIVFGMPFPSPCSSLKSLSVRNCPGFGSSILSMVGKLCPQIHHVDLSGVCGITDAGLIPLLESCEAGLVKLNLSGCINVTDEAVLALGRLHGTTLEVLNLDSCRRVSDASLVAVAENCLFLSDLDVTRCAISDSGIAALSRSEHLNLQVLSVSGCSGVSNKSIPFLRKMGKTLIGLNLQNCNSLSARTVDMLVESLWRCDILF